MINALRQISRRSEACLHLPFFAAFSCAALLAGCAQTAVLEKKSQTIAASTNATITTAVEMPAEATVPLMQQVKAAAPAEPIPFEGEGWKSLLSSSDPGPWQEVPFGGRGEIERGSGMLLFNMGEPFTGIRYTNEFPTSNYEIAFDAMRVMGSDFFCGLTVPVEDSHCTLVLGGWGGSLIGISSVNGMDASENETTGFRNFEKLRWNRVRLRVTKDRLEAWLDKDKIVDLVTKTRQISMRAGEIELCKPLGIASWQTAAAFRNIQWRPVNAPQDPPPKRL